VEFDHSQIVAILHIMYETNANNLESSYLCQMITDF